MECCGIQGSPELGYSQGRILDFKLDGAVSVKYIGR